jgi:hypothetical protein
MHDITTGVYTSHASYERQREAKSYFERVIKGYRHIRLLSPIVSINCDPLAKSTKLDVAGIHFLADVALATRKALNNDPQLLDQWEQLMDGQDVPNASSIVRRCASVYERRKLAPSTYFRTIKEGRRDRRPCIQGAA